MKAFDSKKFNYYGALLYAFLVPFHQQIATIPIIVWLLLSLVSFKKDNIQISAYLLFLPLLYLTYFMGFLVTDNATFKFVGSKLSFLVFPLIFLLHAYSNSEREKILISFVFGLLGSVIICLMIATFNAIGFADGAFSFRPNILEGKNFMESVIYGGNYFFGSNLSIFHQTVYYAMYLCTGVSVLLFYPNFFSEKRRCIFLFLFIGAIFLVSNKASFIALGAVLILRICTWKTNRKRKLMGVSFFSLVLVLFMYFNPRLKQSMLKIGQGKLMIDSQARYGFTTRILSWDAAISLIKERPLMGYGHENAQTVLNNRYEKKGYIYPLKESYNAHNLWMQICLENGILSGVLLFLLFLALFRNQLLVINASPMYLSFIMILLINSMFEVLFNRFSGISFFCFLVCFTFSASRGGPKKP